MLEVLTGTYLNWQPKGEKPLVELDLGCGKGGFLISLALLYPDRLVLGADVMLGRLRRVLHKAERGKLENIVLLRANAWDLIGHILPDNYLYRVHIICPDPWPKRRHRSKRLLTSEFFGRLAVKLQPRGIIHLATDDSQYFDFMQQAINPLSCFQLAESNALEDIRLLKSEFEIVFDRQGIVVNHLAYRRAH